MLLQQIIQTQAEYMTTKGNSAWDKLCALVAKQPDTAKCNTEHGLTQLSTGLAVMSLSAVPKILKTPNNFPNDSAEQHKLVSASASALRGTESQVANCNLKPPPRGGALLTSLPYLKVLCRCYGSSSPSFCCMVSIC